MKKVLSGASVLCTGALLFFSACVVGGLNIQSTYEWDTYAGRFWTSVSEAGLIPLVVISIIMMVIGIALMASGIFDKKDTDGK